MKVSLLRKAFGTIVAERVADLLMLVVVVIVTLFLQFDFILGLLTKKDDVDANSWWLWVFLGVFVFGTIVFVYVKKATSGFGLKIKKMLNGLVEGMLSIFKMKEMVVYLPHHLYLDHVYSYVLGGDLLY